MKSTVADRREESTKLKDDGSNLIVTQSSKFRMADKVWGQVSISKSKMDNKDGSGSNSTEEFTIMLSSEELNANDLKDVLNGWVREYKRMLNDDKNKNLKFYLYHPHNSEKGKYEDYVPCKTFLEYYFESGKTFKSLFFYEKQNIIKRLDFFINNRKWFQEMELPYTLGFLFHGDPGCGKTSTIKAIANYTRRHIVLLSLNKIKNMKELLNVFYETQINHAYVPLKKRLYVLEDIDAEDFENIVVDRSKKQDKDKAIDEVTSTLGNLITLLDKNPKAAALDSQKLTLANILEVMDGIMEMEGRMLIITTNYPERLDKALIRPGRIDMNIKFERMRRQDVRDLFQHYFKMELPGGGLTEEQLPDMKMTAAEVSQVFLNNLDNPDRALKILIN